MGAALLGKYIVAKAQDVLLKGIHKLNGGLYLDLVHSTLKIDRIVNRGLARIQFLNIGHNAFRLMVSDLLLFPRPLILIVDGQLRIQIGSLMKTAFKPFGLKSGLLKNLAVRKEIDSGSGLPGLSHNGKQPVLKLDHGLSFLIFVMVNETVPVHLYIHVFRQGINYGGTHSVKSSAGLIRVIIKFTACM